MLKYSFYVSKFVENERMSEFTVSTVFVKMILEGADRYGVDCQAILLKNGISQLSLNQITIGSKRVAGSQPRIQLEDFAAATREIMVELECEFFGLGEKPQPLGSFAMMCLACISAKNIKRSLQYSAKYWNLFNNSFAHRVLISSGRVYYELPLLDESKPPLNNYATESMLFAMHRFHCWLAGQFIPLTAVLLPFDQPHYSAEYKQMFYGAPIKYNQACGGIEFEASYLSLEIVQTTDTLNQYLAGNNLSLLYQPKHYPVISDQVRQWLGKTISRGNNQASLNYAAKHFHISPQVLHRRLQAEDTSFKEIKTQTRRDIALKLLFNEEYKVEDIASKVGFSEPSAFIRAFKRWTGSTPLNYRQQYR